MANFPVGVHDDVCDGFFHAIKAFTTARDFQTPDLKVMPGHLQSEYEARQQELLEQLEWENVTRLGRDFGDDFWKLPTCDNPIHRIGMARVSTLAQTKCHVEC